MNQRWTNRVCAALAVVVPFLVYLRTMARTVPFWDAGEFTAVAKILGIPHPPGTPLFVLTAHVFGELAPFGSYATRINFVSVMTGMLTALCTYLLTQKLVMHLPFSEGDENGKHWLSYVAGVMAAWYTCFSHSFWNTSTEIAHVHVGASLIMFFAMWTCMIWWERRGEDQNERRLLMIWYVMCVGIGWHLGGFLVLPAAALFTLVVDWRRSWWVGIGVLIFGVGMKWTEIVQDVMHVQPDSMAIALSAGGFVLTCLILHFILPKHLRPFLWVTAGALAAGISVHAYLVIRAGQNPIINEAAPSTWSALWDEFTRKQYAPPSMFERSGNWTYQLDTMFWRYFRDQFTLGPPMSSAPGTRPWAGLLGMLAMGLPLIMGEFGRLYQLLKGHSAADKWAMAHMFFWALVLLLYGTLNMHALAIFLVFVMMIADLLLAILWKREPFVLIQSGFLMGSIWLVIYLNFRDPQVRERDYFFLWGYEIFSVWIGLGLVGIVHELIGALKAQAARRVLVPALCSVGLLMPVATCAHFYFEEDHTGNYTAHDYAYNMLVPLARNAVIFTNGDNDTFPLWYLQEVEGIRTDVRVICLSLLNTHWYIKQLRDLEPKVPIGLTDAEVDQLEPYRAGDGSVVLVKDIMVKHIVEYNKWQKPVYIAVSVPEDMGMEKHLSLEGLSFRILPDTTHPSVDVARTRELVDHVFRYTGLLDKDGAFSQVPYKDENQRRMAGNYSAAHVRLAFAYHEDGDIKTALEELDKAERISPDFVGVPIARGAFYEEAGDTARALRVLETGLKTFPTSVDLNYRLGVMYAMHGRLREGLERLEAARLGDPDNGTVITSEFTVMAQLGEAEKGEQLMQSYMEQHPEDARAAAVYKSVMRSMGREPAGTTVPAPGGGSAPGF